MTFAQAQQWADQLAHHPDARLIILHPVCRNRYLLLGQLSQTPNSLYVSVMGDQVNRAELEEQITRARAASPEAANQPWLILDAYDRLTDEALCDFLRAFLAAAPTNGVILVGRGMPTALLCDDRLMAQARFLPVDEEAMLFDYAHHDPARHLLEVRALGNGHVMLDGRVVDNWDGALPRALFFYLVDRGIVTRNQIFETFWSHMSIREATNVFHVTKRKINEVLGVDLTMYASGFYRIAPTIDLKYDVVQFTDQIHNAFVVPEDEALRRLEVALQLYRGRFLGDTDMLWANQRRDELQEMFGDALVSLAELRRQRGAYAEALGLYSRATVLNPHREDLVAHLMQLYRHLKMPQDAIEAYYRLERDLSSDLQLHPTVELSALAREIEAELV